MIDLRASAYPTCPRLLFARARRRQSVVDHPLRLLNLASIDRSSRPIVQTDVIIGYENE